VSTEIAAQLVGADHEEQGGDPHCGQEKANGRDETAHGVLPTGVSQAMENRHAESRGRTEEEI
jgi:hypothetical protein